MSKSTPKPKIQLTEYSMSVHMGICHGPVDKVHQIRIGEKIAYGTTPERIRAGGQDLSISETTTLSINKPNLHGGERKEGGAVGRAWMRFGGANQTTPSLLASKLGRTTETTPGFRGLLTAWFTGSGSGGFIWGHNTPYLQPVGFRVERCPGLDWYPETARIYRDRPNRISLYVSIDCSSSMFDNPERIDAVKAGMDRVFDYLDVAITQGLEIDIGVQFWSSSRDSEQSATSADAGDLDTLRAFVANFSFPSTGGTPFDVAAQGAADWFDTTVGDSEIDKRVWIFLTDGGPNPEGTADTAETIAADLLDTSSGDFSTANGTAVDCHGVNLVLEDTEFTAQLDNTSRDGVPVITAEQAAALTAIIVSALGIGAVDANPAHMIRECLLNQNWGMVGAASSLDDDAFRAMADTLFAERFGLSMPWAQQSTIEAFVDEVKDHIQGHVDQHPRTGLLTPKLIRGDYDVEDLPVISPDNATLSNWSRKGLGETINEIIVRYTDPESGKPESVVVQDLALISTQGLVSETRDYPGVRRRDLAVELAHRDLSVARAPLATCDAVLDRSMWELVPGDVVKLTWPEYGIVQQVFRVGPVDEGGPGDSAIKVSLAEDVFGLDQGDFTTPPGSEWEDPSEEPAAIDHYEFLTVPYWTVAQVEGAAAAQAAVHPESAVGVLAAQGGGDTSQYDLLTEVTGPSGAGAFETVATRPILSRMELADALEAEAESTIALGTRTQGDGPAVGGFVWIGTGGDAAMELALVTAVTDEDATVKRGVLDTVPVAWPAATPVWFLNANLPWHDPSERAAGETAEYKILPHTSLGLFEEADAALLQFEVGERPHLPSRPADVKVEGVGFGIVDATATDPVDVTVAERNRLTEDSQVLGWTDATVTPEDGQTWKVALLDPVDRTVIATVDGLTGTSTTIAHSVFAGNAAAILRVTADRDGFESLQGHEIAAVITGPTISGTPVTTAEVDVAYDGFTVSATGGLPPYAFSVTAGALPPGITLDPATGEVAGTPTEEDTFSGIVITVTDAAGLTDSLAAFEIVVGEGAGEPGGDNLAALFASGEEGFYIDATDLDHLWQDTGGTTAVTTIGHEAARIDDLSGNGNHLTQGTAASVPRYAKVRGLLGVRFDGVDDILSSAAIDLTHTTEVTVIVAVRQTAVASQGNYIESDITSAGSFAIRASTADGIFARVRGSQVCGRADNTHTAAPKRPIFTARLKSDGADRDDAIDLRHNGFAPVTTSDQDNANPGTGNFGSHTVSLGNRAGDNTFACEMLLIGALVIDRRLSDAECAQAEEFFAARMNVSERPAQGIWTWLQDPRAISVDGSPVYGAVTDDGDITVYDASRSAQLPFGATLRDNWASDDHINPTFLQRASDSRIMAFYTNHNGGAVMLRVSTNALDVKEWGAEVNLDAQIGLDQYTYPNPVQLTDETNDPIYLFLRATAGVTRRVYYTKSTDDGATWSAATMLLANDGSNNQFSPYFKVIQNGNGRIDFACNDGHPDNTTDNSLYHFYYEGGTFRDTEGNALTLPITPKNDLTKIYDGSGSDGPSWVHDIAIDGNGHPVIVHAVYPEDHDQRYRYARWNGTTWSDTEMADAGGSLVQDSPKYTGGVVLDSADPDVVFAGRSIEGTYQICRYETADGGLSFTGTQLTDSDEPCFRPFVVRGQVAEPRLAYVTGSYNDFLVYDTRVELMSSAASATAAPASVDLFVDVREVPDGAGGQNLNADTVMAQRYRATQDGDIVSLWVYAISLSGHSTVRVGLYADSGGAPGALLAEASSEQYVAAYGWLEFKLDAADYVAVLTGEDYWVGVQPDVTFTSRRGGGPAGNNGRNWLGAGGAPYASGLPDPYGSGSTYANERSMGYRIRL